MGFESLAQVQSLIHSSKSRITSRLRGIGEDIPNKVQHSQNLPLEFDMLKITRKIVGI